LTLPAIRRSREVWLLVAGAAKGDAAAAAMGGAEPVSIPAAGAVGLETTLWLLDEEAAAKLPARPAQSD
jgi:6-phosphogluconolactonase